MNDIEAPLMKTQEYAVLDGSTSKKMQFGGEEEVQLVTRILMKDQQKRGNIDSEEQLRWWSELQGNWQEVITLILDP